MKRRIAMLGGCLLALLLLVAAMGTARAEHLWRARAWDEYIVRYSFWGDHPDTFENKVTGWLRAPQGDRGGYHEIEVSTPPEGAETCDRVTIEPLLAVGLGDVDQFYMGVPVSQPDTTYYAEWSLMNWADRNDQYWVEVERVDDDTFAYVVYNCTDDATVFDDTFDLVGDYSMCGIRQVALAYEYYDDNFDANYTGQLSEGDGTPWGYYHGMWESEELKYTHYGTPIAATESPIRAIDSYYETDTSCTGPTRASTRYKFPSQEDIQPPPKERNIDEDPYASLSQLDQALMKVAEGIGLVDLFETWYEHEVESTDEARMYGWVDGVGPMPTNTPTPTNTPHPTCTPTIRPTVPAALDVEIDQPLVAAVGAGWSQGSTSCTSSKAIFADWRSAGHSCAGVGLVATRTGSSGWDWFDYSRGTPPPPYGNKRACIAIRCMTSGGMVSDTDVEPLVPNPTCTGWEHAAKLCERR